MSGSMFLILVLPATGLFFLAAAWMRSRKREAVLMERLEAAEKRLRELQPSSWMVEHRIRRFDLLWFPALTLQKDPPYITSVAVGLPFCPSCVVALKLRKEGEESWVCLDCLKRYPASLADTMVLDAVAKQAVDEFLQRHKNYRLAPQMAKPSA
jgi:ribosomal protein L37AE/L43A